MGIFSLAGFIILNFEIFSKNLKLLLDKFRIHYITNNNSKRIKAGDVKQIYHIKYCAIVFCLPIEVPNLKMLQNKIAKK